LNLDKEHSSTLFPSMRQIRIDADQKRTCVERAQALNLPAKKVPLVGTMPKMSAITQPESRATPAPLLEPQCLQAPATMTSAHRITLHVF